MDGQRKMNYNRILMTVMVVIVMAVIVVIVMAVWLS